MAEPMTTDAAIEELTADVPWGTFTSNVFYCTADPTTLVDVGANFDLLAVLERQPVPPKQVVITHPHPDHVGNLEALREAHDVTVFGFDQDDKAIDRPLSDADRIKMGDHEYEVLHTPGHEPDHVCLYAENPGILFSGDLVFADGSFGRTDLEEGDQATLVESLERVRDTVTEDLQELRPGHDRSVFENPYRHVELALDRARQHGRL